MSGIISEIPIWGVILWALLAALLTVLFYKRKGWLKELKSSIRITLMSLRWLGLVLLGILFAHILIKSTTTTTDDPMIITVMDNSSSMLNYKDSAGVPSAASNFMNEMERALSANYQSLKFSLDDQIESVNRESFKNSKTNLSSPLNRVYDNYYGRNIGALILFSDGNYNEGSNPVMVTDKFNNVPIYTIGVGDTTMRTDQKISNVEANDIAFLDNDFPVEATIEGVKLPGEKLKLNLYEDGELIEERELRHDSVQQSLLKTKFVVSASEVGIHEYRLTINQHKNESNIANNTARFFIEVLDDRSEVLLAYEGLHPDVGAIRSALQSENNLDLEVTAVSSLPDNIEKFDLVIWHNPGVSRITNAQRRLMNTKKPFWYIIGPATDQQTLDHLDLATTLRTTGESDDVSLSLNSAFNLFEVNKQQARVLNDLPPLQSHYGELKYTQSSSILGYQTVGNVTKPEPLYFFGKHNEKYACTYGNGIWRWRMGNYQSESNHEAVDAIIQKTVQYLILKENTSRLRIEIPEQTTTADKIVLKARFYNANLEPITTPTIDLQLKDDAGNEYDYSFLAQEDNYKLSLGKLDYGRYTWNAKTSYNDETFEKSGSFAVNAVEIEKQTTRANHQLLYQMAQNGGGEFVTVDRANAVIDAIQQREDIAPVAYETHAYNKLIDYLWLFAIVVSLFALEWFLRRYYGGY